MPRTCGCTTWATPADDTEELLCPECEWIAEHGGWKKCRECGESTLGDDLSDGYCPVCRIELGLAICDGCGKARPASEIWAHQYRSTIDGHWHTYRHCSECPPED